MHAWQWVVALYLTDLLLSNSLNIMTFTLRIWVLGFDFGGRKWWVLGWGEGDVSVWGEERHILVFSILLFKGLPLFGFFIFKFKNVLTPLCLSRDKTKGQSGKNTTLTPTKICLKNRITLLLIFKLLYLLIN